MGTLTSREWLARHAQVTDRLLRRCDSSDMPARDPGNRAPSKCRAMAQEVRSEFFEALARLTTWIDPLGVRLATTAVVHDLEDLLLLHLRRRDPRRPIALESSLKQLVYTIDFGDQVYAFEYSLEEMRALLASHLGPSQFSALGSEHEFSATLRALFLHHVRTVT